MTNDFKAVCIECWENYNPERKAIGYKTCLACGSANAKKEVQRKAKCIAPAYNKGAYQYVSTRKAALGVGRQKSFLSATWSVTDTGLTMSALSSKDGNWQSVTCGLSSGAMADRQKSLGKKYRKLKKRLDFEKKV